MHSQPDRESLTQDPFWRVEYVHECQAPASFAYTVGLASRGFPELLIPAKPEQPASDRPWEFSARDCTAALNSFARSLIAGRLRPGKPESISYDGGLTTVVWTPGDPVRPAAVDARAVDPSAMVLALRARLLRPREGQPTPLEPDTVARCRVKLQSIRGELRPGRRGVPEFRAPSGDPSFDLEQDFGPMTPLIEAYAFDLSQADPEVLADFILVSLDTDSTHGAGNTLAINAIHARTTGRTDAFRATERYALSLVKMIRGPHGDTSTWRKILRWTGCTRSDDDDDIFRGLSGMLVQATTALLTSMLVFDRLDDAEVLSAEGPWQAAGHSNGISMREPWWAPPHVLAVLRGLLTPLNARQLTELADDWILYRDASPIPRLPMTLRGLAVTGARGAPAVSTLLRGMPTAEFLHGDPDVDFWVSEWASCTAALMSERPHFSAADVHRFAGAVATVLPDLEALLNSPLVADAA
ncbi:hypothetical protein [Rhodococcus sp. NPDC058514]